jgi:hypothetical protein
MRLIATELILTTMATTKTRPIMYHPKPLLPTAMLRSISFLAIVFMANTSPLLAQSCTQDSLQYYARQTGRDLVLPNREVFAEAMDARKKLIALDQNGYRLLQQHNAELQRVEDQIARLDRNPPRSRRHHRREAGSVDSLRQRYDDLKNNDPIHGELDSQGHRWLFAVQQLSADVARAYGQIPAVTDSIDVLVYSGNILERVKDCVAWYPNNIRIESAKQMAKSADEAMKQAEASLSQALAPLAERHMPVMLAELRASDLSKANSLHMTVSDSDAVSNVMIANGYITAVRKHIIALEKIAKLEDRSAELTAQISKAEARRAFMSGNSPWSEQPTKSTTEFSVIRNFVRDGVIFQAAMTCSTELTPSVEVKITIDPKAPANLSWTPTTQTATGVEISLDSGPWTKWSADLPTSSRGISRTVAPNSLRLMVVDNEALKEAIREAPVNNGFDALAKIFAPSMVDAQSALNVRTVPIKLWRNASSIRIRASAQTPDGKKTAVVLGDFGRKEKGFNLITAACGF